VTEQSTLGATGTAIGVSRLHFPVTALGPGSRVGIWLQGCSIRCPGCISADTWATSKRPTTVGQVLGAVQPWLGTADGVTISGGEPFDQSGALKALLTGIRALTNVDVLVFSGHSLESLQDPLLDVAGLIDAVVTDPFLQDLPPTKPLRGSANQRLTCLTKLGRERFEQFDRALTVDDRHLDIGFDDGGEIWLAGIPMPGDFERLRKLLIADGHDVATTEDRSCRKVI
jgi:anaerobic ribonucleoside-triphosphate reductase activating protein